jgi:hypothetical protein
MAESNKLTAEKRKQFDEHYKKNLGKLPICPTCKTNNNVIPTVRGKPTTQLLLYAQEGHVKLSGCTQSYHGWCKTCQKFL